MRKEKCVTAYIVHIVEYISVFIRNVSIIETVIDICIPRKKKVHHARLSIVSAQHHGPVTRNTYINDIIYNDIL